MRSALIFLMIFFGGLTSQLNAQFTDRYWTFGEHAAIDFRNLNNPLPDTSKLNTRGTCASICDSLGNLLFYAASPDDSMIQVPNNFQVGFMCNKNHQKIDNSDSLKCRSWYQEMTIIPNPGNKEQFYVFQAGVTTTPIPGFSYSIVDLSFNGGLGKVIQKNVQLFTNPLCDAVVAVKHGNGRDWWVVVKPWSSVTPVNSYYVYLISPSGISPPIIQPIGSSNPGGNIARMKFTLDGNKLFFTNSGNTIEYYNFNRCNGILSNPFTIHPNNATGNTYLFWGMEISPDQSKLYLTSIYQGANQDSSYLYQFDLNASNVYASKETLAVFSRPNNAGPVAGLLQLGPDGKVYLSTSYEINDCGFQWLYCDTSSFFTENMNLSVINHPDSLGVACDFQPYSFYLGGHRSYVGLPNNPNYELGKLVGSPCDTLGTVGINEVFGGKQNLFVYYDTDWQKAFINAKGLTGKNYNLIVYDITGKAILTLSGSLNSEFYTYSMPMESFASGMYVISLITEREKLTSKIVKE